MVRDSEHGFTKGKFCLTDHMAVISGGLTASLDKVSLISLTWTSVRPLI